MKSIQLIKRLESYPLFTQNDIAKIINKNPEYVRTLLYRLHKGELINRIEKGKYSVYSDPMIFASHLIIPSYLSLWTALRYYNMVQQQPFSIFVISPVARRKLKFQNTEIIFLKTKHIFGYKKERYMDFDIFMAEKEKAIIDGLLFHLPLEDLANALDNDELNFKKLAEYAEKTKNISLIKRLGYLLEIKKGNVYGLKANDNNFIRLDYNGSKNGKKNKKWKIIINIKI